MAWKISYEPEVEKFFEKADPQARLQVRNYLRKKIAVNENPKIKGKPLRGQWKGFWRYRIGKYRIICNIQDEVLTILVVKIGKRDEVYES